MLDFCLLFVLMKSWTKNGIICWLSWLDFCITKILKRRNEQKWTLEGCCKNQSVHGLDSPCGPIYVIFWYSWVLIYPIELTISRSCILLAICSGKVAICVLRRLTRIRSPVHTVLMLPRFFTIATTIGTQIGCIRSPFLTNCLLPQFKRPTQLAPNSCVLKTLLSFN